MHAARLLVLLALTGAALGASAQYAWIDKSGRKVFSDRPPPTDIPERNILAQPRRGTAPIVTGPAPAPVPAAAPNGGAPVARLPGKDGELEERRKQAEAADAAKRKATEAQDAAARADNCQRARQNAAALDSGIRMAQVDAQGQRSFMDDGTRMAESQRAQSIIASDCR